jgi:molecular chaperone GrpE
MIAENDTTSHTTDNGSSQDTHGHSNGQVSDELSVKLQDELSACKVQVSEWKDKYLRVNADLDNVNRRAAKDRALSQYTAQVALLLPLLTIVDDFERAIEQRSTAPDVQKWAEGITMIYTSLLKYLTSVGVEPMTNYDQFDPELHEALTSVVSDSHTSGSVVSVLQKGYLFKGQLLRPAKVSVAQ